MCELTTGLSGQTPQASVTTLDRGRSTDGLGLIAQRNKKWPVVAVLMPLRVVSDDYFFNLVGPGLRKKAVVNVIRLFLVSVEVKCVLRLRLGAVIKPRCW